MHSMMKCSGRWLFPSVQWSVFIGHGLHTCNQLFVVLFIFHLAPSVENAWFPGLKMFHLLEKVASEGADDGFADRSSEIVLLLLLSRLIGEWRVRWCRTENRRQRVRFSVISLGSVCHMALKKFCKTNTLVLFAFKVCIQMHETLLFSIC